MGVSATSLSNLARAASSTEDTPMRVAIMGAGAAAFAATAFLAENGHECAWSPSGKSTEALPPAPSLISEGKIAGEFRPNVAPSCEAAVIGADAVLIALPANGHKHVMDAMALLLSPGSRSLSPRTPRSAPSTCRVCPPRAAWRCRSSRSARRSCARAVPDRTRSRSRPSAARSTSPPCRDGSPIRARSLPHVVRRSFPCRGRLAHVSLSNVNPQSHMALASPTSPAWRRAKPGGRARI